MRDRHTAASAVQNIDYTKEPPENRVIFGGVFLCESLFSYQKARMFPALPSALRYGRTASRRCFALTARPRASGPLFSAEYGKIAVLSVVSEIDAGKQFHVRLGDGEGKIRILADVLT